MMQRLDEAERRAHCCCVGSTTDAYLGCAATSTGCGWTKAISTCRAPCAGSGCVFAEGHGNWLHSVQIEVQQGVARLSRKIDYQWDDAAGDFIARA
jgi:hypothetical protein